MKKNNEKSSKQKSEISKKTGRDQPIDKQKSVQKTSDKIRDDSKSKKIDHVVITNAGKIDIPNNHEKIEDPEKLKAEIENENNTSVPAKKNNELQQIEDYMNAKYEFRFNEIKSLPEFRINGSKNRFNPINDYVLNSLKRELIHYGLKTSTKQIDELLKSEFNIRVNPVKNYFSSLPEWDLSDNIAILADTVKIKNTKYWHEYFTKWLVACVANVMIDDTCANHTCLVLTGSQGKFKTTFLETLCPDELKPYLFTGKINVENKDTQTLLAEFFLINIDDQLRQLNKKDENEIKNLITINKVKYRRPYDRYIVEYPHMGSFMASVNGNDFLTDVTGNRRFLPFEAEDIYIDKAKAINIDDVWIQANHLFRNGFKYWFSQDELQALHENNAAFTVTSIEEELIANFFFVPDTRSKASHFYTTSMLKVYLEQRTNQKLSVKKLGESMTKLNFEKWQQSSDNERQWVWSVLEKTDEDKKLSFINQQQEVF